MISVKVRTLTSLLIACAALPQAALARDVEVCANLYRRLNSTPQIIGTTSTVRRYAQDLSAMNADIRQLRIDMRRQGCGGSIVTLGENSDGDECGHMQETLQRIEDQRAGLTEQRNNSRSLLQPSEERVAILSAIRANSCTPTDLDTQTELEKEERIRIRGIALPGPDEPGLAGSGAAGAEVHLQPRDDAGSSITHIGGAQQVTAKKIEAPIAFPPERPYDPERKVRTIGPQFFPDENIDLANPKSSGPQPQQ